MGEKFWIQDFETGLDRLRVHFVTDHGQIVSVLVIQYEAFIDGKWHAIVRYDEAHGFFHRDLMSPTGKQEKTPLYSSDRKLAFDQALEDIKSSWRSYRQVYEDRYDETK